MSPDDHYQDLKRIIAAVGGKARRITVIMPFLYESRQHKRTARESLDCALALQELVKMGVITSEKDVLDSHRERVKKAYPAYFDTYDHMDDLIKYLDTFENLYCVGRNGQHRYNNMDHSMATSFETVDNILSGRKDKKNIWSVNTEKEYHEEKKEA